MSVLVFNLLHFLSLHEIATPNTPLKAKILPTSHITWHIDIHKFLLTKFQGMKFDLGVECVDSRIS